VETLAEEGETIEVGQTIAVLTTGEGSEGATVEEEATEEGSQDVEQQAEEETTSADEQETKTLTADEEPQRIGSDGRFYSPLVRSIAKEEGITQDELESIEGSGQGGRVSKQDIMSYLDERSSEQHEEAETDEQPKQAVEKEETDDELVQGHQRSIKAGELDIERPSDNIETIEMGR